MKVFKNDYVRPDDRYDINKIKRDATKANRISEKGIINDKADTSVILHDNGSITMASSKYSNYSLSKGGHADEVSLESRTTTNRKVLNTDELIINKHKLNPALYELTDPREVLGSKNNVVMGLNIDGTVLVKTWDKQLGKYVLIRRPYRAPMFSPTLNSNKIPDQIK